MLRLAAEPQEGSWRALTRGGSAKPVTRDVFTLLHDHGVGPTGDTYEYAVLPDTTAERVAAYTGQPPYEVLRNDADVQAVRHRELAMTGAVFYAPAELALPAGGKLSVDHPCAVMLSEQQRAMRLAVANPAYELGKTITLELSLPGTWRISAQEGLAVTRTGAGTAIHVVLPDGATRVLELQNP